jgi:hypothetical protein
VGWISVAVKKKYGFGSHCRSGADHSDCRRASITLLDTRQTCAGVYSTPQVQLSQTSNWLLPKGMCVLQSPGTVHSGQPWRSGGAGFRSGGGARGVPKRHQPNSHATKAVSGICDQGPLSSRDNHHPSHGSPSCSTVESLRRRAGPRLNTQEGETAATRHLGSFGWVFYFLTFSMHEAGPPNLTYDGSPRRVC